MNNLKKIGLTALGTALVTSTAVAGSLDVTGTAATSMFRIVRTANDPGNDDNASANSNVVVQISPAASISN